SLHSSCLVPSPTSLPPPPPPSLRFSFHCSAHHRHLHSFPTRRSSDLSIRGQRTTDIGIQGCSFNLFLVEHVVAHDSLIAARTDANVGNPGARELLEAQHIILRLLRQLVERGASGDVFVPRRHGFINWLCVVEL